VVISDCQILNKSNQSLETNVTNFDSVISYTSNVMITELWFCQYEVQNMRVALQ
jgi:hypothetical protein